jgi:hypothetical protein
MRGRRRWVRIKLVLEGLQRRAGLAPVKMVARANRWFEDLVPGRAPSFTEIASRVGVHPR